jgi:hypothetical protein
LRGAMQGAGAPLASAVIDLDGNEELVRCVLLERGERGPIVTAAAQ